MTRHHRIDYIEFSVLNIAESKDFYAEVFGWSFVDYGPHYCGIVGREREMGGFAQVDQVQTGGPLVVLYSDDLASSFERALGAGAKITKEIFSFPGGRRFQFTDPSGHELAVWSQE